jgi:phosphoribosylanthranilate isomerase
MMITNLKICGITTQETARFCAEAGVGALGAVFFAKSPRHVTPLQARVLFEGLPERIARVGVFVDVPAGQLVAMAREAALDTVQLHGSEPLATIRAAQQAGFHVVKVLKSSGEKMLAEARTFPQEVGILIECGRGTLPGGNGAVWNWADAAPLSNLCPFALAGGLTPQNLREAARLSHAAAWDVSSGVESEPGLKDHEAIRDLLENARKIEAPQHLNFWKGIYELRQT